jgi:hypothetical protein
MGSWACRAVYTYHRSVPTKDVLLFGTRAYNKLVESIKLTIGNLGIEIEVWTEQIQGYKAEEEDPDVDDAEKANATELRTRTEGLVGTAEQAIREELKPLLDRVEKEWNTVDNCVLGHVLRSPPIGLSVGAERFTEDWAVFQVDKAKLGQGYMGNKIDLGAY